MRKNKFIVFLLSLTFVYALFYGIITTWAYNNALKQLKKSMEINNRQFQVLDREYEIIDSLYNQIEIMKRWK